MPALTQRNQPIDSILKKSLLSYEFETNMLNSKVSRREEII